MKKQIEQFYKLTKFNFLEQTESTPLSEWPLEWRKVFYKIYSRFSAIPLKRCYPKDSLATALLTRRTNRDFSPESLSLEKISEMLQLCLGISTPDEPVDFAKRTYPSAGARYPVETYLVSNNVDELDQGLYHYNVKENTLEVLLKEDLRGKSEELINSKMGSSAPVVLILTGAIGRSEVKYGVNAYRFALIECGHIGQNISLYCESRGLGSCAIGGFDNDRMSKLIDLSREEIPLYVLTIGRKDEVKHP